MEAVIIGGLLHILHLLADALQFRFGGNDVASHLGGVGLGPDGVAFAEHLLGEKVESAAVGLFGFQSGAELGDVAFQTA